MSSPTASPPRMPITAIPTTRTTWRGRPAVRRIRLAFRDQLRAMFDTVDVLIAPATPSAAPRLDQTTLMLGDRPVPLRPNVGIYTQPISFIGLPVVTVPVDMPGGLPIGIQ